MSDPQAKTTAAPNAPPVASLAFKAPTFAALLPSAFLNAHLNHPSSSSSSSSPIIRPSGRIPTEFREPAINLNGLAHTHGSAVVRLGNTSVVVGVMGEILLASDIPNPPKIALRSRPRQEISSPSNSLDSSNLPSHDSSNLIQPEQASVMADLGLIVPNVELSTGCHPTQPAGNPPSSIAQTLSQRVLETIHSTQILPLHLLEIWGVKTQDSSEEFEEELVDESTMDVDQPQGIRAATKNQEERIVAYWALYIDIIVLSLDGNAFDAIWAAVLAALAQTRLPQAWWNRDRQLVLCDPDDSTHIPLQIRGFPVSASFAIFDPHYEAVPISTHLRVAAPTGVPGEDSDSKMDSETGRTANGKWLLADPDGLEESVCAGKLSVIVDCSSGKSVVKAVSQHGGNAGAAAGRPDDVLTAIALAEERWAVWKRIFCAQE